jgi:hypothetical protein
MALVKIAVDEFAKKYWSEFYGSYGKLWVRDIAKKIKKAAIEEFAPEYKVASGELDSSGVVTPFGHAILDNGGVAVEGVFDHGSIGKHAFQAKFDEDGEVISFDTIKLTAGEGETALKGKKPPKDGSYGEPQGDLPDTKLKSGHASTSKSK